MIKTLWALFSRIKTELGSCIITYWISFYFETLDFMEHYWNSLEFLLAIKFYGLLTPFSLFCPSKVFKLIWVKPSMVLQLKQLTYISSAVTAYALSLEAQMGRCLWGKLAWKIQPQEKMLSQPTTWPSHRYFHFYCPLYP